MGVGVTYTVEDLARLKEEGFSLREVSSITGIPFTTIRDRLYRAGVDLGHRGSRQGTRLPHSEFALTSFLYNTMGWSTTEIGEHLSIKHSSVCWRLDQAGVTRRSRGESARIRFARRPKMITA